MRADDEVHVRQFVNELPSAALGHAAHKTQHHAGAVAADFGGERLHFADGLLLGGIAHTAGVEQDDVGGGFRGSESIALGNELRGDGFGVALVHLAPVGFDIDTRHNAENGSEFTRGWEGWKG